MGKISKERSSDDTEGGEYEVERILERRKARKGGGFEYLIRWKGYDASEDSWVLGKDLSCDDLVQEYLDRSQKEENQTDKSTEESSGAKKSRKASGPNAEPATLKDALASLLGSSTAPDSQGVASATQNVRQNGFERGLTPHRVLELFDRGGDQYAAVQFRNSNTVELISLNTLERLAPNLLIAFYEGKFASYHLDKVTQLFV